MPRTPLILCTVSFMLGVTLSASLANAGVVTYDGDVFPEDVSWERVGSGRALRTLEDGCFVQVGQEIGYLDAYQRSLADFAGAETFFVEWRLETDAPSSLLDSGATPLAVSLGGTSADFYHTTVADSRVRLLHGFTIPLVFVFVDIEPGLPHTYRVELRGTESYTWYVDGELVDSGVPAAPYPTESSVLIWGVRHYEIGNTTRWDYLRYGEIPEPATGLLLLTGVTMLLRRRRSSG